MSNHFVKNNDQRQDSHENRIVIDDGTKVYNIYNQRREKLGQFVFSPADAGLVERYKHAVNEFEDVQKMLENVKNEEEYDEVLKNASDRMKNEFDVLFDANVSESFFVIAHPFTPLESGEFFSVHILNAVMAIIEKETGIRLNRAKTRANKYTRKYHN